MGDSCGLGDCVGIFDCILNDKVLLGPCVDNVCSVLCGPLFCDQVIHFVERNKGLWIAGRAEDELCVIHSDCCVSGGVQDQQGLAQSGR